MSNSWFQHPDVRKAESDVLEAERLERRGNKLAARTIYLDAALAFGRVAQIVPPVEFKNTREALLSAAEACTFRAAKLNPPEKPE